MVRCNTIIGRNVTVYECEYVTPFGNCPLDDVTRYDCCPLMKRDKEG